MVGAGLVTVGATSGTVVARGGGLPREIAAVRSATARYNDPANAYADGYAAIGPAMDPIPLEDVVDEAEAVCGMGFHVANLGLFGSTDPLTPQVLVYGVGDDGDLVLGAVEYIVPKDVSPTEPDLFAHDGGAEAWDEDLPFPGVWSLHVWVHNHNPEGMFSHANPRKQFSPDGCLGH